jgi:hypothetical protein
MIRKIVTLMFYMVLIGFTLILVLLLVAPFLGMDGA